MARAAWSRDGRLASWTSLGHDLVDWIRPVLERVVEAIALLHLAAASAMRLEFQSMRSER
jgi:hypothetical protein